MKKLILFSILVVTSLSCLKKKDLPDSPRLTTSKLDFAGTSATMTLGFTDGDGNFGLEEADTTGVFGDCLHGWNLFAEYYELQNGIWTHIEIDPCDGPFPDPDVAFYYRIPWAKPTGQDQTQEGDISIQMDSWYIESQYDTIKFEVKMIDRDLNESNTVVIGPFVK